MRAFACLSALLTSAVATALPPPVPINIVLFAPGEPESTSATVRQLLDRLAADNWIGLGQVTTAEAAFDGCAPSQAGAYDPDCLVAALEKFGGGSNTLVVMAHNFEGSGAQHRFVCVGPDRLRRRSEQFDLRNAAEAASSAAAKERRQAASCLIGALHGPRGERG